MLTSYWVVLERRDSRVGFIFEGLHVDGSDFVTERCFDVAALQEPHESEPLGPLSRSVAFNFVFYLFIYRNRTH